MGQRKVFGGIGKKLLLWFLVISITPAIIMTFVGYQHSKNLIEEQLVTHLDGTVEMVSNEIHNFIKAKKGRLIDFCSDGLIRNSLVAINAREPGFVAVAERLNYHLLKNKLPLDPDFIEILVIDLRGNVVASSNRTRLGMNVSGKGYFIQGWRHGIYVSDLHYSDPLKESMMSISRAITNLRTGVPVGMMVIDIRGSALSNVTRSWDIAKGKDTPRLRGLGRTGEVYIVNEDNLMITESRFVENAVLKQVVDTAPVNRAFSSAEELSGIYLDYRGVKILGASRLIDEMRWVVLAEKDLSEVIEPIIVLRNVGMGLIIADAVVVIIFALLITRSLTNPIHKLVTATEKVAKGDLDYRILATSKDEIGHLSNAFNEMTQHLKKSSGEHRALFDDGVDAMFVLSDGERITDVNKSACDLLGQERDALIGTNLSKLIGHSKTTGLDRYTVTEARHTAVEAIRRTWVLETGKKYPTFDVPLTSKESEDVLCELDLKRIPHGIYAVFRDITERKRLEEAIVSEKQRLDDIVSEIGAGLSMVDKNMKVVWMNKVQSSWFGELKDVKGHECFNVYWDANEVCKDCPSKKTFTSGTVEKAFKLYTTSDGKQRWYSITSSPLKDRTGEVTHVLELLEDVTKEKLAEEEFKRLHESVVQANIKLEQSLKNLKSTQQQLIQAEKLASMGQLAASVAHEINNPLSYIDNNLEILNRYSGRMKKFLTKCDAGRHIFEKGDIDEIMCFFQEVQDLKKETKLSVIFEDFGEVIKESRCGTDQIKKIVSSLGTFSRVEEDLPTSANINEVIESILAMVWGELKHKATVIKEYGDIPKIECYPQQLGQVFMNLLTNAAHAIESTGEIRIKTYKADDTVCVEIKDTGKGIPGNLQPRIFEPFFTTKEPGKGTGLGLTVVYNIIQRHLGSVIVSSKVGEGTTFKVCFPIRE